MQRSYVADLETGRRNPSVRTLVRLANAFGVAVAALLETDDKPGTALHVPPPSDHWTNADWETPGNKTLSCSCLVSKRKNFVSRARTTPLRSVVLFRLGIRSYLGQFPRRQRACCRSRDQKTGPCRNCPRVDFGAEACKVGSR